MHRVAIYVHLNRIFLVCMASLHFNLLGSAKELTGACVAVSSEIDYWGLQWGGAPEIKK